MIKACVFDLDGTLADTLESMAFIANGILEQFSLKRLPVENFKYYCGEGASVLVQRCLKDAGDTELALYEECERLYRREFSRNPMYKVSPYEGIPETLKELKEMGVKIAVCSNKPHDAALHVVNQMFGDIFDLVLGQREGIRRKPAPDAPLLIAETLGVSPAECMYIGDTGTDMQTGKGAKMFTVGVLWGFRTKEELLENRADALAEKPSDLIELLKKYIKILKEGTDYVHRRMH